MKKRRNRYIERIAKFLGESEQSRALEVFVGSHRPKALNLEAMAKALGVSEVIREPMPLEGGIFEVLDGNHRLVIKINSLSSGVRQTFTLAHEIAHLMLDQQLNMYGHCAKDRDLEDACDAIAAELLMPARDATEFVRQLGPSSSEKLKPIANRFGVSLQTAARRVHDLCLWRRVIGIGLWHFEQAAEEKWFVGTRPWKGRRQQFSAFSCALSSPVSVQMQERYFDGYRERAVYLDVLNLGKNYLLGLVA